MLLAPTHVVGENVGDGHEDGVLGSGGGQVQPELQVTDRVAAQVLQLHKTTHSNYFFVCFVFSEQIGLARCCFLYPEVSVELWSNRL